MPTDACQWHYECSARQTLLESEADNCCELCSYGSALSPSAQLQQQQ